jgi:hypothetical protein
VLGSTLRNAIESHLPVVVVTTQALAAAATDSDLAVRWQRLPELVDLEPFVRFMALELTEDSREAHTAWREQRPPVVRGR